MRVTTIKLKKEMNNKSFPIVAVGASAGVLESVTQLFQNLPVDSGMAFIYMQHLSPDYKSVLAKLLSKVTPMKVLEAKNGMQINPNTVYVIPAGKEVNVIDNYIKLISNKKNGLPFVPGDLFFSSLAEQRKEQVIGIVLSGSATDGTNGLKAIKKQRGLTFAQNDSEKFMSKPISVYAEAILSTIHEPMVILDKNLRVKSANKSFYEKFHVNEGSTEGLLFHELGSKQWNIPRLRKLIEDVYFKGKSFEGFEVKLIFPKIGEKIMLLNAKRFAQSSNNEHLIILAMQDITEHTLNQIKEKNEQLKKNILEYKTNKAALEKAVKERTKKIEQVSLALKNKNHELEGINKKLTSFTYIASHDLQEPLRKIQVLASHILEKEEKNLSEKGKDYFQRMQQAAKRMQTLIEDLLAYSHTNIEKVVFEKTDISEILKEIKDEFKEEFHAKGAKIQAHKLPVLNVIRFQFHQLLHNLISNALKFSDPQKPLQININYEIATGNKFKNKHLTPKSKYCHITINDNGIGFEPQFRDRIFEVFQRLHGKDEYKGTGIGLAICKKIVENHHGFITASGELKKGATFDIYLPIDL